MLKWWINILKGWLDWKTGRCERIDEDEIDEYFNNL